LVAARNGSEEAPQRHEGLARTDIALQQPVHGDRLGKVRLDLLDRPLLRTCQGKGKAFAKVPDQFGADIVGDALGLLFDGALAHH
jgi:hypothetical protein